MILYIIVVKAVMKPNSQLILVLNLSEKCEKN